MLIGSYSVSSVNNSEGILRRRRVAVIQDGYWVTQVVDLNNRQADQRRRKNNEVDTRL